MLLSEVLGLRGALAAGALVVGAPRLVQRAEPSPCNGVFVNHGARPGTRHHLAEGRRQVRIITSSPLFPLLLFNLRPLRRSLHSRATSQPRHHVQKPSAARTLEPPPVSGYLLLPPIEVGIVLGTLRLLRIEITL